MKHKTISIGKYFWSTEYVDVPPLENSGYYSEATADYNSCENTLKLIQNGDNSKYPAAWAATNYVPTAETKGKWCLPAAGILNSIYNNVTAVNNGISKVNGLQFVNDLHIWSSSEYDYSNAWYSSTSNGANGVHLNLKYVSFDVRPVITF